MVEVNYSLSTQTFLGHNLILMGDRIGNGSPAGGFGITLNLTGYLAALNHLLNTFDENKRTFPQHALVRYEEHVLNYCERWIQRSLQIMLPFIKTHEHKDSLAGIEFNHHLHPHERQEAYQAWAARRRVLERILGYLPTGVNMAAFCFYLYFLYSSSRANIQ